MNKQKPAICLVAHNAYGILAQINTGHTGGLEVMAAGLARWLAASGFRVSMITWDEGFDDGRMVDGVQVFKLCQRHAGLPLLRFFSPRWRSLRSALNRANPDLIYYSCGDLGLGQIVQWAHAKGKKVCYAVVDDFACYRTLPALQAQRERWLYRYGLRRADHIIVQTRTQQALLKDEWGLSSVMIPMYSDGMNVEVDLQAKSREAQKRILWVGRLSTQKRLEWLLDIAEASPDYLFDVVGDANTDTEYARSLKQRAASMPNVVMHGRVAHNEMGPFYQDATMLCSTSVYEGFPNVFLEAWSAGLPIVTSFDPDGVVERHGLGKVAHSAVALKAAMDALLAPDSWSPAAKAAKRYFHEHHKMEVSMRQFESEFINMMS